MFDVTSLAHILKNTEESIVNGIIDSYRHKVPKTSDTIPRFGDLYKKVFMTTSMSPKPSKEPQQSVVPSLLPSLDKRQVKLKGKELEKREEYD